MKVIKFGGTSMSTAEQIKKVCKIILSDKKRRIVVVSAPGKRFKDDEKVTDLLIKLAEKALSGAEAEIETDKVLSRYNEIADGLGLSDEIKKEIERDIRSRVKADRCNHGKYLDNLKAAGEDNSAKLVADYLRHNGVSAKYISPAQAGMVLDDEYGNAKILPESYENLASLKDEKEIIIFPGFFGFSKTGEIVTFSRGGSDITGSILAAAVMAEVYENYTDVDYVFAANPAIIKDPKPIPFITYEEMRELSYAGFTVLHEESLEPVYRKGIPVNIRNTNNPDAPGTLITRERIKDGNYPVVGIACEKGFVSLYISKYMMNREIGFGRKLMQILEEEGIAYDHTPSGIDNISVVIREKNIEGKLDKVTRRIYDELDADSVSIDPDNALLMLVGEGMAFTIGVAARAAKALAKANVNIEMINQGSSEVSLMFGIKTLYVNRALIALYNEFFPD